MCQDLWYQSSICNPDQHVNELAQTQALLLHKQLVAQLYREAKLNDELTCNTVLLTTHQSMKPS